MRFGLVMLAIAGSAAAGCKGASSRPDAAPGGAGGGGSQGADGGESDGAMAGTGGGGGTNGAGGTGGAGMGGARVGCDLRDIDVPVAEVRGSVTIAGQSGVGFEGSGRLVLTTPAGDQAAVGPTNTVSFAAKVIPGTYALSYWGLGNGIGGPGVAPQNGRAPLRGGVVVATTGVTTLNVDVPVVTVSGTVTVGGSPLLDAFHEGRISLINAADGVDLGFPTGTYSVNLVPGTFDLEYYNGGGPLPQVPNARTPLNSAATLRRGITLPSSGTFELDIDVPVATATGKVTINGVAPAPSDGTYLYLWGTAGHEDELGRTLIGYLGAGQYLAKVLPGTYDFSLDAPGTGTGFRRRGIVFSAGPTNAVDIDIPLVTVTGAVSVGGVAGSFSSGCAIYLVAGDPLGSSRIPLGSACVLPTYTTQVLAGTYDVYYGSDGVRLRDTPGNSWAKIASQVVVAATGTTTLNVDVPSTVVSGAVTINGSSQLPPPTAGFGEFFLRGASGDEAFLTRTDTASYSARIVPGTYDLFYRGTTAYSPLPTNSNARLRTGIVVPTTGPMVLDIDLPMVTISGSLTIAGAPVADTNEAGLLFLRGDGGDTVELGATSDLSYSVPIIPGAYDLYYDFTPPQGTIGKIAPTNVNAWLRCFDVTR